MTSMQRSASELERLGGASTAREIAQQPAVWLATEQLLGEQQQAIHAFLAPLLARPELRIILTGAGSSAYIGRCLQPDLLAGLQRRVEALATTDLVAGPDRYLQRGIPTLLVSFARSGSSPESVAATELADQLIDDCQHLVLTCNATGELYRRHTGAPRSLAIALPEASHDRGFAMTSSFSSMLYAAFRIFVPQLAVDAARIGPVAARVLGDPSGLLAALAASEHSRVVFLGSLGLAGLADEAALKLLELTDGEVAALANSTLGFRHGPKTFVNPATLVVVFASNDPLTRRYDLDLARELTAERLAGRVLVLSAEAADLGGLDVVIVPDMGPMPDAALSFPYLAWAQQLAFGRSLALGRTPDSPSRSGAVHRVVKGVTIYPTGGGR
jgi:tagatose-6-phosphate ketose/aldose isomerase